MKKVKVTWAKSTIGCIEPHRRTIQALGLRRRGQTVVKELTPQIKGMLRTVDYLLKVEEVTEQ